MTQKIVVAGASGPLGRAISSQLRALGHVVTGVARSGGPGVERADLTDPVHVRRMLESVRPDSVVYLARPDLQRARDPWEAVNKGVRSIAEFAEMCAARGVEQLVFASSAAVYGTAESTPRREDDEPAALSPYAALKHRSELALASAPLPVISLRVFNVYGPGFSSSLVNRLVLGDDPPPIVLDSELFVRDYIHATDVARAFSAAVEHGSGDHSVVNVGTGIGTSNRSLLALCPEAEYLEHSGAEIASFSVADTRLSRDLWGFHPAIDLAVAISQPDSLLR